MHANLPHLVLNHPACTLLSRPRESAGSAASARPSLTQASHKLGAHPLIEFLSGMLSFRPNCGLGHGQLLRRVEASPYLRGPLLGLPRRKLIMVKRRETKVAELRDQKAVSRRDLVKAGA